MQGPKEMLRVRVAVIYRPFIAVSVKLSGVGHEGLLPPYFDHRDIEKLLFPPGPRKCSKANLVFSRSNSQRVMPLDRAGMLSVGDLQISRPFCEPNTNAALSLEDLAGSASMR